MRFDRACTRTRVGIWTNAIFSQTDYAGRNVARGNRVNHVLDASVPAALDALVRSIYRGLRSMGWDYFKLDPLRRLRYEGYNIYESYFAGKGVDPDHIELSDAEAWRSSMVTSLTGSLFMLTDKPERYRTPFIEPARRAAPVLATVPAQLYDVDPSRSSQLAQVDSQVRSTEPISHQVRLCLCAQNDAGMADQAKAQDLPGGLYGKKYNDSRFPWRGGDVSGNDGQPDVLSRSGGLQI
jgi:hypothetical protein